MAIFADVGEQAFGKLFGHAHRNTWRTTSSTVCRQRFTPRDTKSGLCRDDESGKYFIRHFNRFGPIAHVCLIKLGLILCQKCVRRARIIKNREKFGSAGHGKNRTNWNLVITVAIPFSRWGAEPFVASPIIFPREARLKAQPTAPPEKKIPPMHPFQLALLWQQQIAGDSKLNQARIATREGLSRARVTQVMNLLRLPERVQSELQNLPPPLKIHSFSERLLRRLLSIEDDEVQLRDWVELLQKLKKTDGE